MDEVVPALYEAVRLSSRRERRERLDRLTQELEINSPSTETLLLGLAQPSSDVRQVVLGALTTTTHSSASAKALVGSIIDIIRQSLRAASASLSALRLISACLKALSSLLCTTELSFTSLDMQSLVEVILATMAWGLLPSINPSTTRLQVNARQWKVGPGSAFSFDKRGSQGTYGMSTTALGKKSSSASLSSLNSETSTFAIGYSSGFETDHSVASDGDGNGDDEQRQRKLKEARRGVRYRSIGCINVLNDRYTRLLLLHWPRLLLDTESGTGAASLMDIVNRDDSITNRIAAVHAVQALLVLGARAGFMAGAEEGSRLRAFTSLSSRMASMIVDLRRLLLAILADNSAPSSLLEATLKCTRALVISTPFVKLRTTHSQALRERILQLCSRPEAAIAVSAYSLLSALVASDKESRRADSSDFDNIIATLRDTNVPLRVRIEAWNTMTALAEKGMITDDIERTTFAHLLQETASPSSPLDLRQSVGTFVQACLAHTSTSVDRIIVEQLCNDDSAIIRSIAANCLISLPHYEIPLRCLLADVDSTVRAAAVRAIGVKIQSEDRVVLEKEICRLLQDDSLLVRMRASWSLGNLCKISDNYAELLSRCYSLRQDDERVTVNAIRGVGALLCRCHNLEEMKCQDLVDSIFDWLLTALEEGNPKLRWNVAACLARCLTIASTCKIFAFLQDSRLALTLAYVIVQDGTFKVRLSAVQALQKLIEHKCLEAPETREAIKQAVERAIDVMADQITRATFREAQLHAIPLQGALTQLSQMLHTNSNV